MTKKVGYKSPPDHTKWRKGQSGNPSGRKKGQRNFKTLLIEELATTIEITEGGRTLKISKKQLLAKTFVARALKGNVPLLRFLMQYGTDDPEDAAEAPLKASDEALIEAFLARRNKGGTKP